MNAPPARPEKISHNFPVRGSELRISVWTAQKAGIAASGGQDPKNIPKERTNAVLIMVGAKS
jgi:hypothetical protein